MSIIERAAQRLEELRRAGIEVPGQGGDPPRSKPNAESAARIVATPSSSTSLPQADRSGTTEQSTSRTEAQIELDLVKLASLGYVTPDKPRSRIADEFRILKRPLIANASSSRTVPIKHGNLVMVTSAVPGEGKTFSAINLAMSIAMELDKTVLLVDADVARPSLPTRLGLPESRGLLDLLDNKDLDMKDVLLRTNVEKLTLLTSGTPHAQSTELLASTAMNRLLDELSRRYADRVIIFDSPPLLVTTEARVLATQMGQVVFVVHAESTLQSDVKKALAAIETCPIKLMVLNQARSVGQGAHRYGYGYGYGS